MRWKFFLYCFILTAVVFPFLYGTYVLLSYLSERPRIALELHEYSLWLYGTGEEKKKSPILIYATGNALLGEYSPTKGSWMTMPECARSTWLKRSVLAAEDRNFYNHPGISIKGITRAAFRNLNTWQLKEGGGTLTQQLARNLFTDRERSFYRKLYETFVAFQMENKLSKDEILCLYLNKIYMGEGCSGAEEASWYYFKKPPWELSAAEAAMIVGLLPSPARYSPLNNINLSLQKQKQVLESLVSIGDLSKEESRLTRERFLKDYQITQEGSNYGEIGLHGEHRNFLYNLAPAVNEYVKYFLHKNIQKELINEGNLRVYTTIDPRRQAVASRTMRRRIRQLRQQMVNNNPYANRKKLKELSKRLNGVFIAMNAEHSKLLALVGGYDANEGIMTQRIWSMLRQPGSSIKGFLYAVALDSRHLQPNSIVLDGPLNVGGYNPRNWYKNHVGSVRLARAVAMSINTVAVKTLKKVGIMTFRNYMGAVLGTSFLEQKRRFPLNLSMALGSAELTPMELTQLYATIVNGGYSTSPYLVQRVEDRSGYVLWEAPKGGRNRQELLAPSACANTIKLLQFVFDPRAGGTASFIGRRRNNNPNYLPFPIAGKTGTVQMSASVKWKYYRKIRGARDAWFVGMVPREVAVIWFGQDEGAPIPRGGIAAAETWAEYAQQALGSASGSKFPGTKKIIIDFYPTTKENLSEEEAFWRDNHTLPASQKNPADGLGEGYDPEEDLVTIPRQG